MSPLYTDPNPNTAFSQWEKITRGDESPTSRLRQGASSVTAPPPLGVTSTFDPTTFTGTARNNAELVNVFSNRLYESLTSIFRPRSFIPPHAPVFGHTNSSHYSPPTNNMPSNDSTDLTPQRRRVGVPEDTAGSIRDKTVVPTATPDRKRVV